MAKATKIAGKAYRTLATRRNSVSVQPLDTEYPHITVWRYPGDTVWWTVLRGTRLRLTRSDEHTFDTGPQ